MPAGHEWHSSCLNDGVQVREAIREENMSNRVWLGLCVVAGVALTPASGIAQQGEGEGLAPSVTQEQRLENRARAAENRADRLERSARSARHQARLADSRARRAQIKARGTRARATDRTKARRLTRVARSASSRASRAQRAARSARLEATRLQASLDRHFRTVRPSRRDRLPG